jgi:2-dehydropantoate 2-reductase
MKIVVIGAGGVGGYFGARLSAAGEDVTIVARGEHARVLRERGLIIDTPKGEELVRLPRVHALEELEGHFDVVLLAVKWPALEAVCEQVPLFLAPHGVVVPLLNGLDSEDVVARYVGAQRTLAAVAYMSSGLVEPGRIYAHGNTRAGLAPYRPGQDADVEALASRLDRAGIPVRRHQDHLTMLWEKMVWNAPFNAICALTGKPAGQVVERAEALVRAAMREVIAVARADGAQLSDVMVDLMLQLTRMEYPLTEPSMLQDVRAGRATEVDILQGAVVERADRHGVDVPVLRTLATLVRTLTA